MTKDLITLVREYFTAKSALDDFADWRNLQVKGAARQRTKARRRREFNAADDALRAAVGVDSYGKLIAPPTVKPSIDVLACADSPTGIHEFSYDEEYAQKHHVDASTLPRSCEHCGEEEKS